MEALDPAPGNCKNENHSLAYTNRIKFFSASWFFSAPVSSVVEIREQCLKNNKGNNGLGSTIASHADFPRGSSRLPSPLHQLWGGLRERLDQPKTH